MLDGYGSTTIDNAGFYLRISGSLAPLYVKPSFLVNIYEPTTKRILTQDRVEGLLMCCAKRVDFENTELSDNDLNCELIFILTKELDDIREGWI